MEGYVTRDWISLAYKCLWSNSIGTKLFQKREFCEQILGLSVTLTALRPTTGPTLLSHSLWLFISESRLWFKTTWKQMSWAKGQGKKCHRAARQKHISEKMNRWHQVSLNSTVRTLGSNRHYDRMVAGVAAPSFEGSRTNVSIVYSFMPWWQEFQQLPPVKSVKYYPNQLHELPSSLSVGCRNGKPSCSWQ